MTIKASDLIRLFRQALDEHWGYIWGESGSVWTQSEQNAATRDMTVQYGQKWVGKRVADCSGLFRWAASELGGYIYHGSNTMWNTYTDQDARGAVGGKMTIAPGTAVFQAKDGKRTHVGLYVGEGKYGAETVIEAQGTRTGVVESELSAWDEWGELLVKIDGKLVKVEMDVPYEVLDIAPPTLRKGDSGEAVKELQEALIAAGYDVGKKGADGIFGSETLSAVRAFQGDRGLTPDGIAGPLTHAALRATEDDEPEDDEDEDKAPMEEVLTAEPMTVEQRVRQLELAVFGMSFDVGGGADG